MIQFRGRRNKSDDGVQANRVEPHDNDLKRAVVATMESPLKHERPMNKPRIFGGTTPRKAECLLATSTIGLERRLAVGLTVAAAFERERAMSRLDKQLDKISGEQMVKIVWPADADVDTDELRSLLVREIDRHRERIPLDLRDVDGAPSELVELLHDLRRYALSKSKVLSTSRVLPPLRKALEARARRPIGKSVSSSSEDCAEQTSDVVNELLKEKQHRKGYDLSKAEKIDRKKGRHAKPASKTSRYLKLGAIIFLVTSVVAAAEMYYLFYIDTESPVKIPDKTHEQE